MTKPIYPHEMRSFAGMDELVELALDLRWSWDHGADNIWRPLAPELWDLTRNPWVILQTVGPGKLKELADNKEFCSRVKKLSQEERTSRWLNMPASLPNPGALRRKSPRPDRFWILRY